MSRIAPIPTCELWNLSEGAYLYRLQTTGALKVLVEYYEMGITLMTAHKRDIVATNPMSKIVDTELGEEIKQIDSTIKFYELRLAELR